MTSQRQMITRYRQIENQSFVDLCEKLERIPTDKEAWRGIFGAYLDNYVCTVIIRYTLLPKGMRKEFLAYAGE